MLPAAPLSPSRPPSWQPRLAALWAGLAALGAIAVVPYALAMSPVELPGEMPPLPVLMAIQAVQIGVMSFVLALVGLRLGQRVGLDTPIARALVEQRRPAWPRTLLLAAAIGALAGAVVVGVDSLLQPLLPPTKTGAALTNAPPHLGLLATLYGAISEEVLLRLGLMATLAGLFSRFLPKRAALALGLLISTLLFGLLHLPATAMILPLTPLVVMRGLVLNAVVSVACGGLFAWRGLEHAVVAHALADIVLHVVGPLLLG